jgi:hypothetical protein
MFRNPTNGSWWMVQILSQTIPLGRLRDAQLRGFTRGRLCPGGLS